MLGNLDAKDVLFLGLLLAAMWLLQFALTYRQMRRFYTRLKLLRKRGLLAVGMNGNRVRGRTYAVLVVDDAARVVAAEGLHGSTVFAGLRPFPALVGMTLADVQQETALQVPAPLRPAFAHAARSLAAGQQATAVLLAGDTQLSKA